MVGYSLLKISNKEIDDEYTSLESNALCHFLGLAPILVFETPNACLLGKAELLRKAAYCDLYRLLWPARAAVAIDIC